MVNYKSMDSNLVITQEFSKEMFVKFLYHAALLVCVPLGVIVISMDISWHLYHHPVRAEAIACLYNSRSVPDSDTALNRSVCSEAPALRVGMRPVSGRVPYILKGSMW
jgi:hypothetical protein